MNGIVSGSRKKVYLLFCMRIIVDLVLGGPSPYIGFRFHAWLAQPVEAEQMQITGGTAQQGTLLQKLGQLVCPLSFPAVGAEQRIVSWYIKEPLVSFSSSPQLTVLSCCTRKKETLPTHIAA